MTLDKMPVGSIIHSMLTEAQFQTEVQSTKWVLCDGRAVSGSRYASLVGTNIPDSRGKILRVKNNGLVSNNNPDGDVALGTYQADQYVSHTHATELLSTGASLIGGANTYSGDFVGDVSINSTGASGGNETRMKNITVNIFIKIN